MTILADSCCDLSPELLKKTQAKIAPLTITIDDTHYVDDGTVDIPPYLAAMKASKNPVRSACPSPDLYAEDIRATEGDCFIVTLSAKLSGSHNAASLGVQLAQEDMPEKKVHVFDSESASAGETYIALMIHDLIAAGKSFEQIVELVEEKIRSMHTLFVLDSLDNLVKNGRISRTVALLANVLSIRLLMSDDGHGAIKNISKARGIKGALGQMVETCRKHTEGRLSAARDLLLQLPGARASGARHDPRKVPGHRRNHPDPDLRAFLDVRQRRRHRHRVLSESPFASKGLFFEYSEKSLFWRNMGVFSGSFVLLQSASLETTPSVSFADSFLKEEALWGAYNTPTSLLEGGGPPAGGGRSSPPKSGRKEFPQAVEGVTRKSPSNPRTSSWHTSPCRRPPPRQDRRCQSRPRRPPESRPSHPRQRGIFPASCR